jgi:putative phosphoribosyl transferase
MSSFGRFENREEAGKALADALVAKAIHDPVVLALPRGGVPVAAEIARVLKAPLDLLMVRKIGVPSQPELAAAAVIDGEDSQIVVNEEVCALANVSRSEIDALAKEELQEIDRRAKLYLKDRPRAPIAGRSAIVVDDGIATGTTIRAVIKALRLKGPKSIVLAVPVAPADVVEALRGEVDDIVCLEAPAAFFAIGLYYWDFHQITDDEVIGLLAGKPEAEKLAQPAPPAKAVAPVSPAKAVEPIPLAKAGEPAPSKPTQAKTRGKTKAPVGRPTPRKSVRPS